MSKFNLLKMQIKAASTHPGAISFREKEGSLFIEGSVMNSEIDQIRRIVATDQHAHESLSVLHRIPIQAGRLPRFLTSEVQANQSPAVRLTQGFLGLLLFYGGWRWNGWMGGLVSALGLGGLLQMISGERLLLFLRKNLMAEKELSRQLRIQVPVEFAYRWWSDFRNYPRFMSFIEKVAINPRGGISWRLSGPGSIPLEWDASITRMDPNRALSWSSEPRSIIFHQGQLSFERLAIESCQVEIRLSYAIPAGFFGRGLVRVLGFDPSKRIDDDLLVMKDLLENEYHISQRTA